MMLTSINNAVTDNITKNSISLFGSEVTHKETPYFEGHLPNDKD